MSSDFLSRWSRRKRDAGNAPREADEGERLESGISPAGGDEALSDGEASDEEAGVETAITETELADLAERARTLTAESDMLPFLRKGVPQALRNRALRRLWTVDPAIRDAVGDARDYAWDWNTPGGVPVSGPLSEGTDVKAMLRHIFGDTSPQVETPTEAPPTSAALPALEENSPARAAEGADGRASAPEPQKGTAEAPRATTAEDAPSQAHAQAETDLETANAAPARPRRQGSALPA